MLQCFFFCGLTAVHYDPDTTEPISCSLKSLDELFSWKRNEASPFNVASVPLASRVPPLDRCPRRTLVSHDMMGGYLQDRYNSEFDLLCHLCHQLFSQYLHCPVLFAEVHSRRRAGDAVCLLSLGVYRHLQLLQPSDGNHSSCGLDECST